MRANFRFAKPLVWGSIALLMIAIAGCPLATGPDSDPPSQEKIEEIERTESTEEQENAENTEDTKETEDPENKEDVEDAGDPEDGEGAESAGDPENGEGAEDAGDPENGEETGESGETENGEDTRETESKENAEESSEQDSKEDAGESGGEGKGQDPGDGQNSGEEQDPGEDTGGEEIPVSGGLAIRIGGIKKSEGVYPDMGVITRYLLDFSAQDGKTAESLYLEAGGELVVTLDAGEWEIRAYGLLERGSGPPLAVICGTAQATVYAGRTENVLVVPDGSAALGGEPGFLSWKVKYPEEKIWGAVLTASVKTGENSFIPYTYFDLTDPNAREKTVSLPPGTYRIQSRFMAHNVNNDGPVEIVHIFSGMETASTPVTITGNAFPEAREFSSSDELKAYLDELDDNTADDPYLVKFNGADLSSRGKNGETLETLYKALSRYVTLDLRGCTGTELIAASTKDIPNQANIVSLILPGTVTKIEAKGFAEYKVLKSAILPKVTDIDYAAFNNLDKLETVSAPELTGLVDSKDSSTPSNGVFSNCSALKTVYFPKLKTVAHHAFYVCTALTEVLLPKAASVGNAVFRGCTALKTAVLLEASLIGDYAFFSDKSLENLVLGPVPPEVDSSGHFPEGCPQKLWVPASAVEDYRNSAFWVKKMKDRIYPLTD